MTANEMTRHGHVFIRFPGGKYKAATFSFDDGSVEDMWLVDLLKSHGMKGTFNLNTGWIPERADFDFDSLPDRIFCTKEWCHRMTEEQIRKTFPGSGMELATHGYTHAVLNRLEDDAMICEVMRDRMILEDIMGESVRGHAYAQGSYDRRVTEVLPKAGIVYGRTCFFHDDFKLPTNFMEWGPTCGYNNKDVIDRFVDIKQGSNCIWFDDVHAKLIYIFAHSYEMSCNKDFDVMEQSVEKLYSAKDQIWFCTNMEYYRYTMAFNSLDFNLARDRVYNPSAIPVWIFANDKVVEIGAGEVVSI